MRTSAQSVAVVLFDEVELLDVAGPVQVLTLAGRSWNFRPFKILSLAAEARMIDTRSQLRLEARHVFASLPSPELVLVPGGYGARKALADAALVAWLAQATNVATQVVGIGNGVLLLAKAGALDGADVAIASESREALAELSPSARPDTTSDLRESGKCLTARTASGGVAAALRLVERHLGAKQASAVAEALGVPWNAGGAEPLTIVP
jgi:transcriptional regulator GlxA family with amidase domain